MFINGRRLIYRLKVIGKRFIQERFTITAAALAMTSFLSLVPLMTVMLNIFSGFQFFHDMVNKLQDFVFSNFVPATGKAIQTYIQNFVAKTQSLSLTSTLFLFVTLVLLMLTIERAINDVWHIRRTHFGIAAWLRYWAMLTLIPMLIAVSLAVTSYIVSMPIIKHTADTMGLTRIFLRTLPFISSLLALTALYIIVPNCRVPWHAGFAGGLFASILFELAKRCFVLYITNMSAYHLVYGTLATIPIFIIWVYLSWVIVLLGALVSNIVGLRFSGEIDYYISPFSQALLCLYYLWQAQIKGETLSLVELSRRIPPTQHHSIMVPLRWLIDLDLVSTSEKGDFILKYDIHNMTIRDLHQLLPWKLELDDLCLQNNDWLKASYDQHMQNQQQTWSHPLIEYFEHWQKDPNEVESTSN